QESAKSCRMLPIGRSASRSGPRQSRSTSRLPPESCCITWGTREFDRERPGNAPTGGVDRVLDRTRPVDRFVSQRVHRALALGTVGCEAALALSPLQQPDCLVRQHPGAELAAAAGALPSLQAADPGDVPAGGT